MNTDIQKLHEILLAQHTALFEKLGEEPDATKAKAILMEMREILHRIDVAQNLLFSATSTALAASVLKVKEADQKLAKALQKAAKITEFVKAGTEFLKHVDKALNLAKKLLV